MSWQAIAPNESHYKTWSIQGDHGTICWNIQGLTEKDKELNAKLMAMAPQLRSALGLAITTLEVINRDERDNVSYVIESLNRVLNRVKED